MILNLILNYNFFLDYMSSIKPLVSNVTVTYLQTYPTLQLTQPVPIKFHKFSHSLHANYPPPTPSNQNAGTGAFRQPAAKKSTTKWGDHKKQSLVNQIERRSFVGRYANL
jgi:hypothetical protein